MDWGLREGTATVVAFSDGNASVYLSSGGQIAWSRVGAAANTVIETRNHISAEHAGWLGDIVVLSPDERYLAVFGETWRTHLWIYEILCGGPHKISVAPSIMWRCYFDVAS